MAKAEQKKDKYDYELVENLASIFCTKEEVATILKVDVSTITKNEQISNAYKNGRERGKASLRRLQWESAKKGNSAMLVWLGKQYLDQRETMAIVKSDIEDDELTKSIKEKMMQVKKEMHN